MEDQNEEQRPRRQYQNFRSAASNNWRLKDDAPRPEVQPQQPRFGSPRSRDHEDAPSSHHRNNPGSFSNSKSTSFTDASTPGTRLYVGNLLYSAQKDDIAQFFVDYGFNPAQINMSIDPMTGRNPSYCFVDLETADEAAKAMAELNGKDVLGRAVRINPGVAKKAGGFGESPLRTKPNGRGWKESDAPQEIHKPSFDRWSRTDASTHWNKPTTQSQRVYVGNLPRMEPQSAVESAIQELFATAHLTPTAVSKIISPHPSKAQEPGDHYYLFVDLASGEDVDVAIEKLDGLEAQWGGKVRVSRARENRDRKVNREQFGFQRGEGRREDANVE